MKGNTFNGRLALVGYRPDGVIAVDIGDSMVVLCDVVDQAKSKTLDRLALDRYGPWTEFEQPPSDAVRTRVQSIVNAHSRQVPVLDPSRLGGAGRPMSLSLGASDTYSRIELVQMLQTANLDAASEVGAAQTFEPEPQFIDHCMQTIVPAMQSAGLHVGNPGGFCALLHLQRTGLVPVVAQPAQKAVPAVAAAVAPKVAPKAEEEDEVEDDEDKVSKGAKPMMASAAPAIAQQQPDPRNVAPASFAAPAETPNPPKPPAVNPVGNPAQPGVVMDPVAVAVPAAAPAAAAPQQAPKTIGKPFKKQADANTIIGKPGASITA